MNITDSGDYAACAPGLISVTGNGQREKVCTTWQMLKLLGTLMPRAIP
jgi:hypothetical protein